MMQTTGLDSTTNSDTLGWTPPSTPVEIPEEAIEAQLAQGSFGGVGSVVAVTSGELTINLLFDSAAMAAPASFRAGIQQAAAILSAAISDHITINLKIDYSGTGGGAAAGPDSGQWESYTSIRADLTGNASPGDTSFNALPAGSTIQSQSSVAVWNSQLKLWGLLGANDTATDDGSATFATDINPNLLVGVALHELTHAMGRVPYGPQPDIFDFYRFTTPGNRLFTGGATAAAAYFSLDGGSTKLADYGQTSDSSDFLNSGVQGANDPFNEFYNGSTLQSLTSIDLKQLDALGFHLTGSTGTVIQTDGNTSLVLTGNEYFLFDAVSGTGPELKYGGAPVTVGEFGSIAPIGAVQTASGYEVAWQIPGSNQLTFWTTDGNGNYTSNISGLVSGGSFTSESLEVTFGQDFNHDGTIGVTASLIQTSGSTSLLQIADGYYMYVAGSGPTLKYGGSPVTVGEFGNIAPIAAIQSGSGYEVVWKIPGTNQFTFWATDSNGNYTSNLSGLVSGGSFLVESAEATFGHDFNGDGTVGVTASLVQTDGSTSLLHIADTYYMYINGVGPQLTYGGAPVTDGEFGAITPVGAIQTSSGYDVAWKIPGSNQFTFWTTDSNGNYTSNISGLVSGTSSTVETLETTFHQDLNGDGVIGVPSSTGPASVAVGSSSIHAATLAAVSASSSGSTSTVTTLSGSSGQIVGFGQGSVSSKFALGEGSSTGQLHFSQTYVHDSFHFAGDVGGGTVVSNPGVPAPGNAATNPVNVVTAAGHDAFVFAPNFGAVSAAGSNPATDAVGFKSFFATDPALTPTVHDNASANPFVADAAHDTIAFQHGTTAELLTHLAGFHLV